MWQSKISDNKESKERIEKVFIEPFPPKADLPMAENS